MKHDTPTITGYILWTSLIIAILALAHHCGALSNLDARDPAEGSHIPAEVKGSLSHN